MARIPQRVMPAPLYHLTQRGTLRAQTFFKGRDYTPQRNLLAEPAARANAAVRAFCLMPNHVHVVTVASDNEGLLRRRAGQGALGRQVATAFATNS